MATYTTADAVGLVKTYLTSFIESTHLTPLLSNMKKETTKGITTEWQVQELAAAVDTNHQNEGADYSYVNPTPTVRMSNTHQIAMKAASVSNTLEVVDKAGRDRETQYVKVLKGLELRKDINKSFYKNEAKSSSDPRKCAKLITWITNGDKPADMAFATGDGSDAADLTGTSS